MNGRNRPPQAYPRETITKAYEWLHQQTPATRELANDMETLVSLYLQDQRLKERRRKKSTESVQFKEELKNLAEGVKSFNGDPRNTPISSPEMNQVQAPTDASPFLEINNSSEQESNNNLSFPKQKNSPSKVTTLSGGFIDPKKYLQEHQQKQNQSANHVTQPISNSTPTNDEASSNAQLPINSPQQNSLLNNHSINADANIKNMLQITQNKLHLSSENEALKALISMGYEQIKKIFL